MSAICKDRVVIVSGAGTGLGRAYAIALAESGAKVVVNDLHVDRAVEVAESIQEAGGECLVQSGDVADFVTASDIVRRTVEAFGSLDVIINNAGILRDRMFVSLTEEDWDVVIRVHLKGHFCLSKHACTYWANRCRAGDKVDARIINISSNAGLQGSFAQANYCAAKGGIATLTLVQAAELGGYGITANAVVPSARTDMTRTVFEEKMRPPTDGGFNYFDPANVAPFVVWLSSQYSRQVSGRIFEVEGGLIGVCDGWRTGPSRNKHGRWEPEELGSVVEALLGEAAPAQKVHGT